MTDDRCYLMIYREGANLHACLYWRELPERVGPTTWSRYRPANPVFTCELFGDERNTKPRLLLGRYQADMVTYGKPRWPAIVPPPKKKDEQAACKLGYREKPFHTGQFPPPVVDSRKHFLSREVIAIRRSIAHCFKRYPCTKT